MSPDRTVPDDWFPGVVPENVILGTGAHIDTTYVFRRFFSRDPRGLVLGAHSATWGHCSFNVGENGRVSLGEYSMMTGTHVHCEGSVEIGSRVMISWSTVICDTPVIPAASRALALEAAAADARARVPFVAPKPILIEDDVWIGFGAVILPGVRVGARSVVGACSVVRESVPPDVIVAGNPARIVRQLRPGGAG